MILHEITTELAPSEVIARARSFFLRHGTPDAASQVDTDESFLRLHIEVGEIVIAAIRQQGYTRVRGSASRGAHLLSSFLTTLGCAATISRTTCRHGVRRATAGLAEGDGTGSGAGEDRLMPATRAA
jgi:hypothetical protein